MAYAENTSVSIEKSEAEIKALLRKRGASAFHFGEDADRAMVAFQMGARRVIFRLPLPDRRSKEFRLTPGRARERTEDQAYAAWDQACRSRWRALFLCIKAKLESVESGIETFEEAFMPHIMLPDGSTFGERAVPAIAEAYRTSALPPLLPAPK